MRWLEEVVLLILLYFEDIIHNFCYNASLVVSKYVGELHLTEWRTTNVWGANT